MSVFLCVSPPARMLALGVVAAACIAASAGPAEAVRVYYAVGSSPGTEIHWADLTAGSATPAATRELVTRCSGGAWPGITGLAVDSASSATTPDLAWAGESRWDGSTCSSSAADSHGYLGTRRGGTVTEEAFATDRGSGNAFSGLGMDPSTGLFLATAHHPGAWGAGAGATAFTGTCTTGFCIATGSIAGGSLHVQRPGASGSSPVAPVVSGSVGYFLKGAGGGAAQVRRATGISTTPGTATFTDVTSSFSTVSATAFQWSMAMDGTSQTAYLSNTASGGVDSVPLGSSAGPAPSPFTSRTNPYAMAVLSDGSLVTAGGPLGGATGSIVITGGSLAGTYAPEIITRTPRTPGISAIWVVERPAASTGPVVTGGTTRGSTLSCADATWASDLPLNRVSRAPTATRTWQWSRDGAPIGGATGTSHVASEYGTYECAVTAVNVAGSTTARVTHSVPAPAAPADPGGATMPTTGSVPGTPTGVVARRSASGQVAVSWVAPAGIATVTGYIVTAAPGGRTCTAPAGTTRCTITGLRNGVAHAFSVKAAGTAGEGAASRGVSAHSWAGLSVRWSRSGRRVTARWTIPQGAVSQRLSAASTRGRCTVTRRAVTCAIALRKGRTTVTAGALGPSGLFQARADRVFVTR